MGRLKLMVIMAVSLLVLALGCGDSNNKVETGLY